MDASETHLLIRCPVCNCTVVEDEYIECCDCEEYMCVYCYEELPCPEHAIPYGDPYWQTHDYWA